MPPITPAYAYFDNAATTPLDPEVLEAMLPFLSQHHGNPSSLHGPGRQVRAAIENARKTVAHLIGESPRRAEITFTSGGTEADNYAAFGSVRTLGLTHAITSPLGAPRRAAPACRPWPSAAKSRCIMCGTTRRAGSIWPPGGAAGGAAPRRS